MCAMRESDREHGEKQQTTATAAAAAVDAHPYRATPHAYIEVIPPPLPILSRSQQDALVCTRNGVGDDCSSSRERSM